MNLGQINILIDKIPDLNLNEEVDHESKGFFWKKGMNSNSEVGFAKKMALELLFLKERVGRLA